MSAGGCHKKICQHIHLKGPEKIKARAQDLEQRKLREEQRVQVWIADNKDALTAACAEVPGGVFRVQSFPRAWEHFYAETLPESVQLSPKHFTHVLSVIYESDSRTLRYGVCPRSQYYVTDERLTTHEDAISRAYYKLIEALGRFPITLSADWLSVDVGSSPGGWTQALAQRVRHVYSIDPAPLWIELPPNVTFLLKKVEDCVEYLEAVGPINLLVCDMLGLMSETLKILTPLYSFIASGGYLILTLKLFRRKEGRLDVAAAKAIEEFNRLAPQFEDVQVKWLLTNRHERTLFARKK